jgi:hypothetical protein
MLAEVGWVAEVLVYRSTGNVVDGHLRIELALARDEPVVPVTYLELSEDYGGRIATPLALVSCSHDYRPPRTRRSIRAGGGSP